MPTMTIIDSPVGPLTLIATDVGLAALLWAHDKPGRVRRPEGVASPHLAAAAKQLREYFAGTRQTFTLALDLTGTAFQQDVWQALQAVPFGQCSTYGAIARAIGRPKAVRAVAAAIGRNPVSIVVPCHRVLGRDGALTGFAGGLEAKQALLTLERAGRDAA